MKRQLPPEKTRGCCCLGFGAESEKIKMNAAHVGGWWGNAWGNSNPGKFWNYLSPLFTQLTGEKRLGLAENPLFRPGDGQQCL